MDINKQSSFLKSFAAPTAALLFASLILPGIGEASGVEETPNDVIELAVPQVDDSASFALPNASGALTSPPPSPPDGFMASLASNRYLGTTYNQITVTGPDTLSISAGTSSQGGVAQLGITVYLQQWSGSGWINYGPPRSAIAAGAVNLNYNVAVTKGYYYRTQSIHWAANGAARESAGSFSNSMLISR